MLFRLRDDKNGDPVVHSGKGCFCPSMTTNGFTKQPEVWETEADSLRALAESLEEDAIEAKEITKAEAHRMLRIAHCIDAPEGVGRRWAGTRPTDKLGEWERGLSGQAKPVKIPPRIKEARMAFAEIDARPGAPKTSHADCEHPTTKSARATCRRQRAKG